jgi:hypothetical protein
VLSQTATNLLSQDCGGLGWPQKQHGVDGRNVNALSENIDAEHSAELALLKAPEDRVTLSGIRLTRQGHARKVAVREGTSHVFRVLDGHAEPERTHLPGVQEDPLERMQQSHYACVITGEDAVEVFRPIAAATPFQGGQIDIVVDAEILKRREIAVVDRLPQAEFDGCPMTEPAGDVLAIHAFGCCRQTEQFDGLEVLEQRAVARRSSVVNLIDHDDVEGVGAELLDRFVRQRLHIAKT